MWHFNECLIIISWKQYHLLWSCITILREALQRNVQRFTIFWSWRCIALFSAILHHSTMLLELNLKDNKTEGLGELFDCLSKFHPYRLELMKIIALKGTHLTIQYEWTHTHQYSVQVCGWADQSHTWPREAVSRRGWEGCGLRECTTVLPWCSSLSKKEH